MLLSKDEMQSLFDEHDTNHDGTISASELLTLAQLCNANPTTEDITTFMTDIDKNKDGRIDFKEFCQFISRMPEDPSEELRQAFQAYDKNGDGVISLDELKAILTGNGDITEAEVEEMLMGADVDHDNKVNYHEFISMVTQ